MEGASDFLDIGKKARCGSGFQVPIFGSRIWSPESRVEGPKSKVQVQRDRGQIGCRAPYDLDPEARQSA